MNEEKYLKELMGVKEPLYKEKYELDWCDLCEAIIIKCPDCEGTSCNCMGCEKCLPDQREFDKHKNQPSQYMTEDENKAVDKHRRLKKYIFECLRHGFDEINWEWLYREGKHCQSDFDVFPELKKLDAELHLWDKYRVKEI
jgi:hypothetical protein